jgi:hypothetical protein
MAQVPGKGNSGMKKAILVLALAALPSRAANTSGIWAVDGSVAAHSVTPTCTLKQTDKTISGSCKLDVDHAADVTGSVKGKEITWKYDTQYDGTTYTLTYVGTLDSDTTMKGTIAVDPSDTQGEFTAKKQ